MSSMTALKFSPAMAGDSMGQVLEEFREFYNLKEMPFSLLPNTQYYVELPSHQQCFSMLMFAVASGEGIIKVIGEVGTGKTLLCRRLLNTLEGDFYSAYLPNPNLNPTELKRALAKELGVQDLDWIEDDSLMDEINKRLIKLAQNNKKVVLVIDEAQALPASSIEAIRLLTNLETESQKLMQVVLFAQPELDQLLAQHDLRQLRQRITYSHVISRLDKHHVAQYVHHRLVIAGYVGESIFSDDSIEQLHYYSEGIPRLISILCGKAMLIAFSKGKRAIDKSMIKRAAKDTEGVRMKIKWLF